MSWLPKQVKRLPVAVIKQEHTHQPPTQQHCQQHQQNQHQWQPCQQQQQQQDQTQENFVKCECWNPAIKQVMEPLIHTWPCLTMKNILRETGRALQDVEFAGFLTNKCQCCIVFGDHAANCSHHHSCSNQQMPDGIANKTVAHQQPAVNAIATNPAGAGLNVANKHQHNS